MTKHNLTTEQLQKLQDIGARLNHVRREREISLETVAENTCIAKRQLEAIESGNAVELPEPFYIQALVNKYARYLKVPEVELDLASATDTAEVASIQSPRRYWLNFQLRSLHLYLAYILLVVVSVKAISSRIERPVIVERSLPERTVSAPLTPTDSEASVETPPQFISQSTNTQDVSVGIDLQQRCWLKVMVDGKVAFEGILPEGTKRQWTGKKEVTIRAGNAGGVVISFNNQQQKVLGEPGQVEEITYTLN